MTWIKLTDDFLEHPKFVSLSNDQVALWLAALAYCNRHLTDGRFTEAALRRLIAPVRDVDPAEAQALVDAGLWERTDDGFAIHDYLDYQPSKEKVEAHRKAGAQRAQRFRERRNGVTNGVSNTTPDPDPDPDPDPQPDPQVWEGDPSAAFANGSETTTPALPEKVLRSWEEHFPENTLGSGWFRDLRYVVDHLGIDGTCNAFAILRREIDNRDISEPIRHPPIYLRTMVQNGTLTRSMVEVQS